MKKLISLLVLSVIIIAALGSCNKPENNNKPEPATSSHQRAKNKAEIEQKLIGKWKLLYTDAAQKIPPKDLIYILKPDHTSRIEFTDNKNQKRSFEATYEITEYGIEFTRKGGKKRDFQVQFQGKDTVQFTEPNTKNSMTLGRITE